MEISTDFTRYDYMGTIECEIFSEANGCLAVDVEARFTLLTNGNVSQTALKIS